MGEEQPNVVWNGGKKHKAPTMRQRILGRDAFVKGDLDGIQCQWIWVEISNR